MEAHVLSNGRVTIPLAIRERFGFTPGARIELIEQDGWIEIRRLAVDHPHQVDEFLARLAGSGDSVLSTDEIMELGRGYLADA
jgi:AbrB family looped-hinge helix DNA binding protein